MMNTEKLEGISGLLTGILFLIVSIGAIYGLMSISGTIEQLAEFDPTGASGLAGAKTLITAGYGLSALALVAGVFWLITGILHLAGKAH